MYKTKKLLASILILLLCLLPIGCSSSSSEDNASSDTSNYENEIENSVESENATEHPDEQSEKDSFTYSSDAIMWDEARNHVGEYVTVAGPVVGTRYASASNGSPTFLNLGKDYPDSGRFTVVIWGDSRDNYDYAPESFFLNKQIEVTGTISMYNGVPQIENPETIRYSE